MVPQWLNPRTYLNADIRVENGKRLIVKNVDPFNQHVGASGVNLSFGIYGNDIMVSATIHGEPTDESLILASEATCENGPIYKLFDFLLNKGRKDEDQYRKNCHIRILKVLDGPDSEAAKHQIKETPRELNYE